MKKGLGRYIILFIILMILVIVIVALFLSGILIIIKDFVAEWLFGWKIKG